MSRCDRCGGKDHATAGHDAWAANVLAEQQADSLGAGGVDGCSFCGSSAHTSAQHLDEEEREANRPRPRLVRRPFASTAPRLDQQVLLPFERKDGDGRIWQGEPMRPFLPRGLMLWDVGTLQLEAMVIGRDDQLVVSWGRVPARWFTTSQSFEQLAASVLAGVEPPSWGDWDMLHPGVIARLVFDGPADGVQAVMWGLSS